LFQEEKERGKRKQLEMGQEKKEELEIPILAQPKKENSTV
jgi:hypothetical protein